MADYNLAYPDVAIDAILNTAYYLQEAGYIFRGSASDYSGTPSKREWVIAPAGFTGYGISSPVPQGSIGICLYNGTSWVGKIINVLTLDSEPTRNSQNGVTSGGVAATLDAITRGIMETFASLLFDDETASADLSTKLSYAVKFSVSDVYQTVTHLNILAATTSKAGLLSAADKAKIDSFLTNLRSLTFADTTASADQGTQITETLKATIGGVQEVIDSITILAATSSKAGLLSASDKAYIDALPAALTNLSNSISAALALMESLVGYYVCDTAAATAAKTVAATGYSLTNGGCIRIKMTNANTADNVTLNINSTGAKALYYDGAQASSTNTWEAGEVLEVYYDGTQYQCASGGGGKFATGEKVKETSITDEITPNSDSLPTSGAVAEETDNLKANIGYFICDTAAATAAKVVAATGYKLTTGGNIRIKMTNANTADSVTLNINSTGAKALYYDGAQASSTNTWEAGEVLEVYYDGTQYQCASGGSGKANEIKYDDEQTGFGADNVQTAIEAIVNQNVFLNGQIRKTEEEGFFITDFNGYIGFGILPDGTVLIPDEAPTQLLTFFNKVYFIGDSLTEGFISDYLYGVQFNSRIKELSYPTVLGNLVKNWTVENQGKSGITASTFYNSYVYNNGIPVIPNVADFGLCMIELGQNGSLQNTLATDVDPYSDYHQYANTDCGNYCKLIETLLDNTYMDRYGQQWGNSNLAIILVISNTVSLNAANAIIAISQKYNLPYIDLRLNRYADLTPDAVDGSVHYTAYGYAKKALYMYQAIAQTMYDHATYFKNRIYTTNIE